MKKIVKLAILIVCITVVLVGCGRQALGELLVENPAALEEIRNKKAEVVCSDYTVYCTGGGIDDSVDATRYSSGLIETSDRFTTYKYIVQDNETGWKYIFESLDDIPKWVARR